MRWCGGWDRLWLTLRLASPGSSPPSSVPSSCTCTSCHSYIHTDLVFQTELCPQIITMYETGGVPSCCFSFPWFIPAANTNFLSWRHQSDDGRAWWLWDYCWCGEWSLLLLWYLSILLKRPEILVYNAFWSDDSSVVVVLCILVLLAWSSTQVVGSIFSLLQCVIWP